MKSKKVFRLLFFTFLFIINVNVVKAADENCLQKLDKNQYSYSDVKSCVLPSIGDATKTIEFDGFKFCVSLDSATPYVTCNDSNYTVFNSVAYDGNNQKYSIYGCSNKDVGSTCYVLSEIIDSNKVVLNEQTRLNYDSICAEENPGIRQAAKIVGYVVAIIKWVVPLIIIALGAVDFFKAMIANDDKEISKAGQKLIKRIVFGVVVFLIPTIIKAFIGVLEITNGIEKDEDTNFGACTKCIADPFNDCETK